MIEPIPVSLVQSGSDLTEPRIRSDGLVSWVQRWGKRSAIVGCAPGGGPVRELTHAIEPAPGRGTSGGCYVWLDDRELIHVTVEGRLRRQPVDGRPGRTIGVSGEGVSCRAPAIDAEGRVVAYVVDEARVMLTDLEGGETRRLDDGRHEFCFDPAVSPDGSTVSWTAWSPPHMPWDGSVRVDCTVPGGEITVRSLDDAAIQQPRFMYDGTPTEVHDASGWLNVHVGGDPVVAEASEHAGPSWGMGQRSYDVAPDGSRVAFTRNEDGFGSLNVADLTTGDVRRLGRGVHGHVVWSPDGASLVALRSGARTPTQVVSYRVDSAEPQRSVFAIGPNAAWDELVLPEPDLVTAASRHGHHEVYARRYVAGGATGGGRLLCWVHGGPTDQWPVEWRPRFAYWLSRGWDVLAVDPRGTTGHGRAYQQALHGGWGRFDVDDTADLVRHAHAEGWSTPELTIVMGGSSGGLTALGVLADHPELVAGGVTSYPVSDLKALTEATHRFEAHYTDTLVAPLDGSDESERRFAELSPISRAGSISKPLLLMHGADDPVVPVEQSRALAARIEAAGGEVEYVEYDGEGHGFRDPDNVADEYARTERFLARFT